MNRSVQVLGVKMDLGASRRGVDMGPSAIRLGGLKDSLEVLGLEIEDAGDISVEIPELAAEGAERARYLDTILNACSEVAAQVCDSVKAGRVPIVLGGDHSIAMGTLAGLHAARGPGGVLWIDAHADLNTPETTLSGNVHGMGLAGVLGLSGFVLDGFAAPPWVDPSRVAIVGVRQLDPRERHLFAELDVHAFTMSDIDRRGVAAVMQDALDVVAGPGFVHLSLDMDVFDPEVAPGVGTPVRGGFTYREGHLCLELLAESQVLSSVEVVEVNPVLDKSNATGSLAVEAIGSALGRRIL